MSSNKLTGWVYFRTEVMSYAISLFIYAFQTRCITVNKTQGMGVLAGCFGIDINNLSTHAQLRRQGSGSSGQLFRSC